MMRWLSAAVLAAVSMATVSADDWPQWGGPKRDHISREKGLLQKWPQGGPKQVWHVTDAGIGYAGVAVVGNKLFFMGARDGKEYLIAKDTNSGKDVWAAEIGPLYSNENWGSGPRGTPTIIGDQAYTMGGQGHLVAVNLADGKVLWTAKMTELGGSVPTWGYTESPLVENGTVYCTPGGSKGAIAAIDAATGKVRWQSKDFTEPTQYSSIMPADINGARQLVQLTMSWLVGVNAKDGAVLWRHPWNGRTAVIPSPVVRDNLVYVTTGYGVGSMLVKVGPNNQPEEVYKNTVMKNHHGGVVLLGDHVYGYSDGPGWICQDFKTGEEVWADKSLGKGAVVFAGDRLYCLDERTGTAVLAEASPKGWQEHGRFTMSPLSKQRVPRGQVWMHPVVANGKLYLRDQEMLFCYDVKAN
jgi:outer membrane protein assembly factor BamB